MVETKKVQPPAKIMLSRGKALQEKVASTLHFAAEIVGGTLGPGGMPVLIERSEYGLPPILTKDGVTVFKAMAFRDSAQDGILQTTRDAATRTAQEAGDGTTTATVLADAFVKNIREFCNANPSISYQRVTRRLQTVFQEFIEPTIKAESLKVSLNTEEDRGLLHSVATLSGNGDEPLADAVLKAYDIVGDDGNVTLHEESGSSRYEVEPIHGYPIPMGYEECCGSVYPKFINDMGAQRCFFDKVVVIVYHGRISDTATIISLLTKIAKNWQEHNGPNQVVVVATQFGDSFLQDMAMTNGNGNAIKVFPLRVPLSPLQNGQISHLQDICAVVGQPELFDPISNPLGAAEIEDLGYGLREFEATRYRSTLFMDENLVNPEMIFKRVDLMKEQLKQAPSLLDASIIQDRIGRLTGGIAQLKIIGSSNGETKERRDRAEDAICAVRGALKSGCLPGGAWMLIKLSILLEEKYSDDKMIKDIFTPTFLAPFYKLLSNLGMPEVEQDEILTHIVESLQDDEIVVYDALNGEFVDPVEGGILDSTPAVLEAIRNSLSIAANLGILGGVIVFARDEELERREAQDAMQWTRDANEPTDAV
jgi:chaperonin GroEL